jgi:hypothetical protein
MIDLIILYKINLNTLTALLGISGFLDFIWICFRSHVRKGDIYSVEPLTKT